MIPTPLRLISAQRLQEMSLLEQVHEALGSARTLQEFYMITAGLLITPSAFHFDRTFILRYVERDRAYVGKLLVGGNTRAQHEELLKWLELENKALLAQADPAELDENALSSPSSIQLAQHSLWIHLLQMSDDSEWFDQEFKELKIPVDSIPPDHVINRVATSNTPGVILEEDCPCHGLEKFIRFPSIAGRLKTKHGLHALIFADSSYKDTGIESSNLIHFQWLLNHASVTLSNVELVEELTLSSERLQELDSLKSSFLSIVSHELRTPLTSIIGFAHLLHDGRAGELSEQQRSLVTRISQHSVRLQDMVNDLLELAEIETGGVVRVHLQSVDPMDALNAAIPKVHARHPHKDVKIVGMPPASKSKVFCDREILERIFLHLIDNAVKFSPDSSTVRVEVDYKDTQAFIAIIDKGIGLSPENCQKIFDQFYQVDFRLERAFGGMGIGLNVVRLLLEASGGRLLLDSKEGEGSRFTIVYPIAVTNQTHSTEQA